MKKIFRQFPVGTAEYVIAHAMWRASRGRRPSESYGTIGNPVEALREAIEVYRSEGSTTIEKKIVGHVDFPDVDDSIELFELNVPNPAALIKLKPKNSPCSDGEWVLFSSMQGVEHAWNHEFVEWHKEARHRNYPGKHNREPGNALSFYQSYFGEVATEAVTAVGDKIGDVANYVKTRRWPVEKLGLFGHWLIESGVSPEYAGGILYEFLMD
jgi:hypothetical protein